MNKEAFYFSKGAHGYSATAVPYNLLRQKIALDFIGSGNEVLDIGCYDGTISKLIKENGNAVVGAEIAESAAAACRKRGIKCVVCDVEKKLPLQDKSFDVVFAGEILEHIFDTDHFLGEIRRVLRPDGYAVITTPNLAALSRRLRLLFGGNPSIETGLIDSNGKRAAGHIRYFTPGSLAALLVRNGFAIERMESDYIGLGNLKLKCFYRNIGNNLIVKAKVDGAAGKRGL